MDYSTARLNIWLRDRLLPGFLFRWRAAAQRVPDAALYSPTFQPWRSAAFRSSYRAVADRTLLDPERCHVLCSLARQALAVCGDFAEAGVYRGGTAKLLHDVVAGSPGERKLHLFDTFGGMPEVDGARDLHRREDFSDTSLAAVSALLGASERVVFHQGLMPGTFAGLESAHFAFAHVDVDLYQSVLDCCEFIYPRLAPGGIMLFDDYGMPSCPGARAAVGEFFAGRQDVPIVLRTGQAFVFRAPRGEPGEADGPARGGNGSRLS